MASIEGGCEEEAGAALAGIVIGGLEEGGGFSCGHGAVEEVEFGHGVSVLSAGGELVGVMGKAARGSRSEGWGVLNCHLGASREGLGGVCCFLSIGVECAQEGIGEGGECIGGWFEGFKGSEVVGVAGEFFELWEGLKRGVCEGDEELWVEEECEAVVDDKEGADGGCSEGAQECLADGFNA